MLNEHDHPALLSRLKAADRFYQSQRGKSFLLRSLKYLFGFILFVFVLDVIFHFEPQWRLELACAIAMLAGSLMAIALYIARIQRNRLEAVARLLEKQDPSLGSKLINLLQLFHQQHSSDLPPMTRQMAREAVDQFSAQIADVNLEKVARYRRLGMDLRNAAWFMGGFALLLGVFHEISSVEFARFVDPFGDHPPYSFTRLLITAPDDKGVQVIYGKSTLVKVKYSGHQPKEVFLTFFNPAQPDRRNTVPMFNKGKSGFSQQIDGIHSDLQVYAHTRNSRSVSKQRHIAVILTPKFEKAFTRVTPPAYTGMKPEEKSFDFKSVRALEGSEIEFRLQSNRPLSNGLLELRVSEGPTQTFPLRKSALNEVSGQFRAVNPGRLRFAINDEKSIASDQVMESTLVVVHDLQPEISITQPSRDCFVSMSFKLDAHIEASDDYGLKSVRLHRALNGAYSAPVSYDYKAGTRAAKETYQFDFDELGVEPGDVISFFAEAVDIAPNPHVARSETIHVTVISEEDYNSFLRQQNDISDIQNKYSDLVNRFQDLVQEQQKISDKLAELQKKMAQASPEERSALEREIENLRSRQSEVNKKLEHMAGEMEQFVRKNPVYDIESEFQNLLSRQAERIRSSTQNNNSKMQGLQGQKPDLEMLQAFKDASDQQLKDLGQVEKETRNQLEETFTDLALMQELLKDFNRFRQLFETQENLTEQLGPYNSNSSLDREAQIAVREMAPTEKGVEEALRDLAGKLREHAKAAEQKFPKAAQSGRDLADAIDQQRLPSLAADASSCMLQAEGEKSYQLAERLRSEMEKLFSEGQPGEQAQNEELDQYLRLQRGMNPGNTFQQMLQSRKYSGQGASETAGQGDQGQNGSSGSVLNGTPGFDILGGETMLTESQAGVSGKTNLSQTNGPNATSGVKLQKPDSMQGIKPVNRKSDAVTSESPIDEYDELINRYFNAIAK